MFVQGSYPYITHSVHACTPACYLCKPQTATNQEGLCLNKERSLRHLEGVGAAAAWLLFQACPLLLLVHCCKVPRPPLLLQLGQQLPARCTAGREKRQAHSSGVPTAAPLRRAAVLRYSGGGAGAKRGDKRPLPFHRYSTVLAAHPPTTPSAAGLLSRHITSNKPQPQPAPPPPGSPGPHGPT